MNNMIGLRAPRIIGSWAKDPPPAFDPLSSASGG